MLVAIAAACHTSAAAQVLELKHGDHICLVGNALGERMQHHNHFEQLLHERFAEYELVVRNLCFPGDEPLESRRTRWVRATRSGILHLDAIPGQMVARRERLGVVYDAFGCRLCDVRAVTSGIVIGCTQYPLVTRGDALVHVAEVTAQPE